MTGHILRESDSPHVTQLIVQRHRAPAARNSRRPFAKPKRAHRLHEAELCHDATRRLLIGQLDAKCSH